MPIEAVRQGRSEAFRSTLCLHVGVIVRTRSQEKVVGANTDAIITSVAYAHALWYRTFKQFVGNAVCSAGFPINPERSIARRIGRSGPDATLTRIVDLVKEAF